jgi:hypothetical protein
MIWRSPLWMPLAWEIVAVQFGYIGLRLWERFDKTGLLMIGLLGAINEEMARRLHCVEIQPRKRSVNDFIYAVVHHSRGIWHCSRVRIAGANPAA